MVRLALALSTVAPDARPLLASLSRFRSDGRSRREPAAWGSERTEQRPCQPGAMGGFG